jgi:hypothetical protein
VSTKETQLQEELAQARAELATTVDELSAHLDPRAQASRFASSTKQAATDTAGLFTGDGMPRQEHRARNVKVLVGVGVAVLALGARTVLRRR